MSLDSWPYHLTDDVFVPDKSKVTAIGTLRRVIAPYIILLALNCSNTFYFFFPVVENYRYVLGIVVTFPHNQNDSIGVKHRPHTLTHHPPDKEYF